MGTDVNASASTSSSATSGLQLRSQRGDFIVGGSKPTPPYLWLGLAAVGLVLGALFIVRMR